MSLCRWFLYTVNLFPLPALSGAFFSQNRFRLFKISGRDSGQCVSVSGAVRLFQTVKKLLNCGCISFDFGFFECDGCEIYSA